MGQKTLYQISARQIILLAFSTAIIAVGAFLCLSNLGYILGVKELSGIVKAEKNPKTLSDPSTVNDEQNSIQVYKTTAPGVAFITTSSRFRNFFGEQFERDSGNGSGSVIDKQGHILTNYHVIAKASKLRVSFGGDKVYPAELIGSDPDTDLAVIKITPPSNGLTVVPLGDSDKLEVGQKVLAIGNPFGLDRTLTTGVISGLQRPIRARNNRPIDAAIQTDASINPGNSGGPLLDKFGRMIGINSQILSPAGGSVGVGFAVPVNTAKRIVPQLIAYGEVRRPKLGASLHSVKKLNKRGVGLPVSKGLLVSSVLRGGSIERAGLRGLSEDGDGVILGDIILSVDKIEMNNVDDLYRFLDKKKIGETINVYIFREGKHMTIPVRLLPNSQISRGRRRI